MRRDPLSLLMRAAKLADVVALRFPGHQAFLIAHPDLAKLVLVDRYRNYGKQTRGYKMLRAGLGNGLVTSEGSFWRRQRRIAQPAFHRRRIAAFGALMVRDTREMLDRWDAACRHDDVVDIDEEMMALTLRIVGESLLGSDLSDDSDEVGAAVTTLLHGIIDRITFPLSLPLAIPTPQNRRVQRALDNLDQVVFRVIRERRRAEREPEDLLDMLIQATDEETGERMTDRQLRDEVITMVLAGHETTANALTWTFALLSRHPLVADKLLEELGPLGDDPTLDDLAALPYTQAVVKESMRLYPPVWTVARSVTETDELGGFTIPKGAIAFVSPYVLHHDRRFWPNPEAFDPERFLPGADPEPYKNAYLPFIQGPRQCIGAGFAMLEAQLILATVLRRFRPELVAGQSLQPHAMITLRPRAGMRVHLRRR